VRCSTYTVSNGWVLLTKSWPFGSFWCHLCGYLSGWAIFSDIMALNIIGISRCLNLRLKHKWMKWSANGLISVFLVIFSWIPGFILILKEPFGYITRWVCEVGTCDFSYDEVVGWYSYYSFVVVTIPALCVWYLVIWLTSRASKAALQRHGTFNGKSKKIRRLSVNIRSAKTTRKILLLLSATIIGNIYWIIQALGYLSRQEIFEEVDFKMKAYHPYNTIYEVQFALNFLIYAINNEEYRIAFTELKNYVFFGRKANATKKLTSMTNVTSITK